MTLEYKDINIFYTDNGKGNSIVFLHGFLENSNMWLPFIPSLAKNNRVVCIDLLGHGKTGCLGYIHTMELMADAIEAVLKKLEIEKTFIIGHSMGGYVALAFADKNPEMLKGLCLMNSTAEADSFERKKNRDRAILAVKDNHKRFIKMAISNLFRPKNRAVFSEEIKQLTKEALQTPLQGIVAALEGMKIRGNREALLKSNTYKCLMIISKKDPVLDYNSLIKQTRKAQVKVVEFADGHMSHVENENDLLQSIMHFIENN
ncbi:Pimeloyl-ACP methyl ester carboxylesterase [Flaviramulus basaltis]|uniref:Pimeloyl-ACP methyl ester carboxylesterase n=1 Tax=Flaviramulus basaltis TaxID=369401 RepID=A0A1K2IBD2_9FLAO|nr:alpha/beta hydrolase [Flaviramulus basaltis]SFZ89717.1 Pimeloyl-ACP methyl ester carboxylesterase [Flaviramulus basaltis]